MNTLTAAAAAVEAYVAVKTIRSMASQYKKTPSVDRCLIHPGTNDG